MIRLKFTSPIITDCVFVLMNVNCFFGSVTQCTDTHAHVAKHPHNMYPICDVISLIISRIIKPVGYDLYRKVIPTRASLYEAYLDLPFHSDVLI